jgi:flavin-dependent dehydrogenase
VYDHLTAFAAFFRKVDPSFADAESVTLVEAVEAGWWYTARLPEGCRIGVYLTDRRTPARTPSGYRQLLAHTKHVRQRLAGYAMIHGPVVMAANSSRLAQVAGKGWIAAGDAAAAHDPLSSMGISGALATGVRAAEALRSDMSGDRTAIPRYSEMIDSAWGRYLQACRSIYAEERRWSDRPFWISRTSTR